MRILELGCGTGANIWFLAREGFDSHGIDGSETAIAAARQRMAEEGLEAHLRVGDVINIGQLYPQLYFDAVIDVACLQHNQLSAVHEILKQVQTALKPGGRVFTMLVAADSYGNGLGREIVDERGTFTEITKGPLQGTGLVHFFAREEIEALFERFVNVRIEQSIRSLNNQRHWYKHWVVEGRKRG